MVIGSLLLPQPETASASGATSSSARSGDAFHSRFITINDTTSVLDSPPLRRRPSPFKTREGIPV